MFECFFSTSAILDLWVSETWTFLTVEFLFISRGKGGISWIPRFFNPFKLYRYCSWTLLLKSLELKSSDPIEITNLANGNFYWGRLRSLRLLSFLLNVPLLFICYTQLETERETCNTFMYYIRYSFVITSIALLIIACANNTNCTRKSIVIIFKYEAININQSSPKTCGRSE